MPYIELNCHGPQDCPVKVMVFTEGTVLGPAGILRLYDHASYRPIGDCVAKLKEWQGQGAEILYLTSRRKEKQVQDIAAILKKYQFPGSRLYFRGNGQKYKDVVELVMPDILIEDDCRSIGGQWQMCITYVDKTIKNKITSVVVKEFRGIDHLPRMLSDLTDKE